MKIYLLVSAVIAISILGVSAELMSESRNPHILPGSVLYEAKLFLEDFEIGLAPTPSQKVDLVLKLANERLSEATQLIDNGESWRLADSFQPMRSLLLQANDYSDDPVSATEQLNLTQQVSAAVIGIQSKLYDLKAKTPDQSQAFLALNIVVSDRLAEADIERSHFLSVSSHDNSNLALAPGAAVLGASDVKPDYSAWIGLAAILLLPLAALVTPFHRKLRRPKKNP